MGFSILIPILPAHLERLGADRIHIGIVLALYLIAMVLFLPLWGWISDRVGRRPVLLTCLVGTAASFLLMAPARSLALFYLARVLQGFFGASVGTAQAYVTDVTSHEERAWGIGLIGAAAGLGMVFGPAVGGALYQASPWLPFTAPALLAAVAFIGAALFLPESRSEAGGARFDLRELLRVLVPAPIAIFLRVHDGRTRGYLYLFFHLFASFAALESMFPVFAAERFAWTVWEIGLFLSYIGVLLVVTQGLLIRPLLRISGETTWVAVGLASTGTCMIGLSLAREVAPLVLFGSGVALGYGIAYPAFTSLFTKACARVEEVGEQLAHSNAMSQTGRGVGFICAGLAAQYAGAAAPFLYGGLGALAGLLIFALGISRFAPRASERRGRSSLMVSSAEGVPRAPLEGRASGGAQGRAERPR
jgi:MFS family permease